MTVRRLTTRERIADWTLAYHVMLEETERAFALEMQLIPPPSEYAKRTAALAAAILVSSAGPERAVAVTAEDSGDE